MDEVTQWTLHLAEPKEMEPIVTLGGCKMAVPTRTPLSYWRAIEAADTARVEALLAGGEDVNQLGGAYGSSALGWASMAADEPLLQVWPDQTEPHDRRRGRA